MTNITKLPAIIHGEGKDEGKLFTRLRDSDNGAYLYAVQNGDITMYEVFTSHLRLGTLSDNYHLRLGTLSDNYHEYAYREDFGRTAFGVADLADAEKLFEKLANA